MSAKIAVSLVLILITSCVGIGDWPDSFSRLYDFYFPKKSPYVTGGYRQWFDQVIFSTDPPDNISDNERKMRSAVQREPGGFHAFVTSPYREYDGEFGETWFYQCQLLLLVLGDEEFARLLSKEDSETQRFVSRGLIDNIKWHKHPFPKTHEIVMSALN